MMREAINIFSGGMNKDASKLSISNKEAIHIENLRHITELGSSNGALVAPKGTKEMVDLLTSPAIYKITPSTPPVGAWTFTISLTTASGTITSGISGSSGGADEFFDAYYNELIGNSIYADITVVRPSNNELIIYSQENNITAVAAGAYTTVTILANTQTSIELIGSTHIRDDIYIFTTADSSEEGGEGQIWKFIYDEDDVTGTLTLIFAGAMNFSKRYLIEAVGRYENTNTQRLYWTDWFNRPRVINVADPNILNTDITLLSLQSGVSFTKPLFKEISDGGNLDTGMYQLSYRLKGNGSVTQFAFPSPQIHVVRGSETSSPYWLFNSAPEEYSGTAGMGTTTSKKLVFSLSNLDTDYDTIEFVYIYKDNLTAEPVVNSFYETDIPDSGSMEVTLTGNEAITELSFTEFVLFSPTIERVKTINSKDNQLVVANIEQSNYHNLTMNARAYRWTSAPATYVSDINVDPDDSTTSTADRDAINPYNTDETQQYKFQSNGTTLGGQGPNVSYTFTKVIVQGDSYAGGTQPTIAPLVNVTRSNATYNLGVTGQTYTYNNFWQTFKSPQYTSLFKGYARGEVYRFGLVLFDNFGRPGPVNWIGDIKMPEVYDADALDTDENDYVVGDDLRGATAGHWMYSLGLIFTVTIPSDIRSQVSGFSIVRVQRSDADKTRLGMGLLTQVYADTNFAGDTIYVISPDAENDNTHEQDKYTFDCPDFHFKGVPSYRSGDYLRIVEVMTNPIQTTAGLTGLTRHSKYYEGLDPTEAPYSISIANLKRDINSSQFVYRGQKIEAQGTGNEFWNYSEFTTILNDIAGGVGNDTCLLILDSNIDWAGDFNLGNGGGEDLRGKLLCSYERPVASQYGGATEDARSKNVYISCGHYQDVTSTHTYPEVFNLFGGDVFVNFYGLTKTQKNHADLTETKIPDNGGIAQSVGIFYPCESTINMELRFGFHLANKDDGGVYPDGSATNFLTFDQFEQRHVYSRDDDTIQFVAEPFRLNAVSEFDTRVMASNVKINGEENDQWRVFPVNQYKDAESVYGPINRIQTEGDSMWVLQDRAVSRVLINPRAMISTSIDEEVMTGSGEVVSVFQYVSKGHGCKHRWANAVGNGALYFIDSNTKKLIKLTSDGLVILSSAKGMDSFMRTVITQQSANADNPVLGDGIHMTYDYLNNELLITFKRTDISKVTEYTLAYNSATDNLSPFYTFYPKLFINDKRNVFSPWNGKIWIHGKGDICNFYGQVKQSKIVFICNDVPSATKVFDNLKFHTEAYDSLDANIANDTFNFCRVYNDYQNTGSFTLVPFENIKRPERTWQLVIPRNIVLPDSDYNVQDTNQHDSSREFKERIRDKYCVIELIKSHTDNNEFIVHYVIISYRQSFR